jgi:DNA-binding XRE family transcriptional regulator
MSQPVQIFIKPVHRKRFVSGVGRLPRGIRFTRQFERSHMVIDLFDDLDAELIRRALEASRPTAVVAGAKCSVSTNNIISAMLKTVLRKKRLPLLVAPARAALRLALARMHGAEKNLISHASIDGDEIRIWSCEPRLLHCPIKSIEALRHVRRKQIGAFEISTSGSRIRWPSADIDLGLEDFLQVCDVDFARQQRKQVEVELARYGEAIRSLRRARGLRQKDIAGLSEREVRRIEQGKHNPQMATLRKLASAHEMPLKTYLDALARKNIRSR